MPEPLPRNFATVVRCLRHRQWNVEFARNLSEVHSRRPPTLGLSAERVRLPDRTACHGRLDGTQTQAAET